MRRYKYGFNGQWSNLSEIGALTPIGYMEVVPGDTVSGSSTVNFWSDTTNAPWMNKMFADVFAFYVPYRLLWERFPDFIRNAPGINDTVNTIPTVVNSFQFNFEKETSASFPSNVFQRRAYNLIWNRFFAYHDSHFNINNDGEHRFGVDIGATGVGKELDTNTIKYCNYRSSTFHESVLDDDDIHATEEIVLPVDGTATQTVTLTADQIRDTLATDNFKQLRNYYGARYADFLAALGVKGQWTMLEEPELIARKHSTLPFEVTNTSISDTTSTPTNLLGAPGGQWKGQVKLSLKRTFCPEHGLVCIMGVNRLDAADQASSPPWLRHSTREDFWSPEYATGVRQHYDPIIWGDQTGTEKQFTMPRYEHLRKGMHIVSGDGADGNKLGYYWNRVISSDDDAKSWRSARINDHTSGITVFDGTFGQVPGVPGATAQMSLVADHRLLKWSPVSRNPVRNPLR